MTKKMKVLVGCEYSGRVRDAFCKLGHNAISCDIRPTESEGPHFQGDVMDLLQQHWDLGIFFPDCTYLTCSAEWCYSEKAKLIVKSGTPYGKDRKILRKDSIKFVERLWGANIHRIAIENPVGVLSNQSCLGKPTQTIQPYDYGDDASKRTCLWLKGLLPLRPTKYIKPRFVDGKPRWENQTDSGQNKLGRSPDRGKIRSLTYHGIADAMAMQWGGDARK